VTSTENRYYTVIKEHIEKHGCCPSYLQICAKLHISSLASVHRVLKNLVRDGYLLKDNTKTHRNLSLAPDKVDGLHCCNRAHPKIWFQHEDCPLCKVLQILGQQNAEDLPLAGHLTRKGLSTAAAGKANET
jgi:SOS-response transcriptional repressor LexA